MSYVVFWIEDATLKQGREPCAFIEIDLDKCQEVYGVGACTAGQVSSGTAQAGGATTVTLAAGDTQADDYYNTMIIKITGGTGSGQERTISDYVNATKVATVSSAWTTNPDNTSTYTIHNINSSTACFNTRCTCQDTANYNPAAYTYRFGEPTVRLPKTLHYFPCVSASPEFTSTKITPGKGIGQRGAISINLIDFFYHDRLTDPYVANRTYDPETQGTFFSKLLARNKHYTNRTMRVYSGFMSDTFSYDYFDERIYLLDQISGPDSRGMVKITGKDILKLADDDTAKTPTASEGKLSAAITDSQNTLTLSPASIGADYGTSGTVRIGDELLTYTGRSSDTLTGLTRGVYGSTAASHSADDTVQLCTVFNDNVVDIVYYILNTVAGISASYLPYNDDPTNPDEWDLEKSNWLSSQTLFNVIREPKGAKELLDQVAETCMINVWWDEIAQKIKLKAISPPLGNRSVPLLTDESHIIGDSLIIEELQDDRRSQVWVSYLKRNYAEGDEPENFLRTYIAADLTREGAHLYGKEKIHKIESEWIYSTGDSQAIQMAGRQLSRYVDPPKKITFRTDIKDASIRVGDLIDISSDQITDEYGARVTTRFEILERREVTQGQTLEFICLESNFGNRYGFIANNGLSDYSAESEANKSSFCFICNADGYFDDGTEGYKII